MVSMKMCCQNGRKSNINYQKCTLAILGVYIFFQIFIGVEVSAAAVYSEKDSPFDVPFDIWINKWWSWWVSTTQSESTPIEGGCVMNGSNQLVMLMETADVSGSHIQNCKISAEQGIMIPLWTGYYEASVPGNAYYNHTYEQLSMDAKKELDWGTINSQVKVDGTPIASLSIFQKKQQDTPRIDSNANVTEIFSKGWNLTIPNDTHKPYQNPGTWRSGAHGYFVILKPLPVGNHEVFYSTSVQSDNSHTAEFTYKITVQ